MKKEDAKQILSFHANKNKDKSFLNFLKQGYMVPDTCFDEIVDAMKCLGESVCCDNMDGETIRDYYTIIFQCRSWLSKDGLLRNEKLGRKLAEEDADLLVKYVEIMENILYYLILGNPDDAFFPYEEFLNGWY